MDYFLFLISLFLPFSPPPSSFTLFLPFSLRINTHTHTHPTSSCQLDCLTEASWRERRRRRVEARHINGLGFLHYLSAAALLTSFLRGLLNKAIPRAGNLRPQPAQILRRYRFHFHRDAALRCTTHAHTTERFATCTAHTSVCTHIQYIVDATSRVKAWLPYMTLRGRAFHFLGIEKKI